MKKIFLFSFSLIIGILLVIWIYQRIGLKNVFYQFAYFAGWQIFILFVLTLVKIFIWATRWHLILKVLGFIKLPFKSLAAARLGEMAVSYLTPGIYWGGEGIRVFALKNKHGIPLSKGVVSVILDRLFDLAGFCIFLFIGLFIVLFRGNFAGGLFLFISVLLVFLLFFIIFKILGINRILNFFVKVFQLEKIKYVRQNKHKINKIGREVTGFFKKSPLLIYPILFFSSLGFFAGVYQLMFFLKFLGNFYSFADSMLAKVLILFAGIIPIPGNLGTYEGASVLAFQGIKLSAETGLSFSLITRLFDFILIGIGIFIVVYYLTGYLSRYLIKNDQ